MKRSWRAAAGVFTMLAAAGCCCTTTKQPRPAPAPATQAANPAPADRALFDGKTLANWKVTDFPGHADATVKDGAIRLAAGNDLTGVTWNGGPLPKVDYEIELEARRVNGGDFFCGLTFPVNASHASLILGGWGGSLCGISSLDGDDAAHNDTSRSIEFIDGKWYRVKVKVTPNRIEAWLDGEQIVDANIEGRNVGLRWEVEDSRPLGVATYRTTGEVKGIRLRAAGARQ